MSNAGSDFVGMVNQLRYQIRELRVDQILAPHKIQAEVFGEPLRNIYPVDEPVNRLWRYRGAAIQ